MNGRSDGNRSDNRQRGNAAQLLEKYKALARDSQLAGDRVQTEYYLQYAEHYFRVLGESQARIDEQRRARGETVENDYDDDGDGDDGEMDGDDVRDDDRPQRQNHQQQRAPYQERGERAQQPNGDRYDRGDRSQQQQQGERQDRYDRQQPQQRDGQQRDGQQRETLPRRDDRPQSRDDRPQRDDRPPQRTERFVRPEPTGDREDAAPPERTPRAPRANGRIRRDRDEAVDEQRIAFDVIPPAIGPVPSMDDPAVEAEQAPTPRRRVRRPRPENDAEVAPAA